VDLRGFDWNQIVGELRGWKKIVGISTAEAV
jgi:hypothetical protein